MKIAVCGRMRSGKDTLANRLVEEYGFKEFKFSQGINEIINKYFPEHAFSEKRPRKHQQFIGQGMRQLDKDVWVNYTLSYVEEYLAEHGDNADVVISDLRQENEARILRQNGFTIVNVYAFNDIRMQRIIDAGDIFAEETFCHETERSVDDITCDLWVENNETLDEFKCTVDNLIKSLKKISL